MQVFIIITNIIIANEMIFNILIKFFKKFQSIITMHSIDINNETNSNIIINTPITVNDIEFKHFLILLSSLKFLLFI